MCTSADRIGLASLLLCQLVKLQEVLNANVTTTSRNDVLYGLTMRHHVPSSDPVDRGEMDLDPLSELWLRNLVGSQVIIQRHDVQYACDALFKNA